MRSRNFFWLEAPPFEGLFETGDGGVVRTLILALDRKLRSELLAGES